MAIRLRGGCGAGGGHAHGVGGGFEGLDTHTLVGVDEGLALVAVGAVGVEQGFDHVGHFGGGKRWANDFAGHGFARQACAVGAAEGDLVPLLAVFVDAEHADVAAVVVAAGVDATADVQVDFTQIVQLVEVLVAGHQRVGDGQRAGVGQVAEVAAGAGDHVAEQTDVGLGQPQATGFAPQLGQLVATHPGQQQVLLVGHAGFAGRETVGQIGCALQLFGVGVAGR